MLKAVILLFCAAIVLFLPQDSIANCKDKYKQELIALLDSESYGLYEDKLKEMRDCIRIDCRFASSKKYKEELSALQQDFGICVDKSEGVTVKIKNCFGRANDALTTLIIEIHTYLRCTVKGDSAYYGALETEQLAWDELLKAAIDNVYEISSGGTIYTVFASGLAFRTLINRLELLIDLVEAQEFGLSEEEIGEFYEKSGGG